MQTGTGGDSTPLKGWLADRFAEWGFSPQANFEAFPLLFQVVVGFLAALVAWSLIHSGQRRAAEENRRIERAKVLHELDREYAELMARRCVIRTGRKAPKLVDPAKAELFEQVLTSSVPWWSAPRRPPGADNVYETINGARHVEIAEGYHVDTLTLHRVIAWSKRVASAIDARIVDRKDVVDMWRHILPWARGNRFSFMAEYFGVSQERAPLADRNAGLRSWRTSRVGGVLSAVSAFHARIGDAAVRWTDRFRTIPRGRPQAWSGDIAPLYNLIRTVVDEAVRRERVEILNYIGLDKGPDGEKRDLLDPLVRKVMLDRKA